jgi:hypothetical protein
VLIGTKFAEISFDKVLPFGSQTGVISTRRTVCLFVTRETFVSEQSNWK